MAFNWDVVLSAAKNLVASGSLKPALSQVEGRSLGMARGRPQVLTIFERRMR